MSPELNPYQPPETSERTQALPSYVHQYSRRLQWTSVGLRLMSQGFTLVIGLWMLTVPIQIWFQDTRVGYTILLLLLSGMILGVVLLSAGPLLCLSVPSGCRGRPWLVASIAAMLGLFVLVALDMPGSMRSFAIAAPFTIVAAPLCFLGFMTNLAKWIDRHEIARRGKVTTLVCVGVFVFAAASLWLNHMGARIPSGFLGFLTAITAIYAYIATTTLISALAKALGQLTTDKPTREPVFADE